VIRPLPLKYRRKSAGFQLPGGSHDDEMFMDEEDFRDSDSVTVLQGRPPVAGAAAATAADRLPHANDQENLIRRKRKRSVRTPQDSDESDDDGHHSVGSHVIYKRVVLESEHDYGTLE